MDFKRISKLTSEIKKGSEKHFKIFFEISHAMVFGVCKKMGLSNENAEEVVQDTYIQFWKQRQSIDENRGVLGLLKVITKRLVMKKINSEEKLVEIKMEIADTENHQANLPQKPINGELLAGYIEKLPFAQKQIINLFYIEGLTTREIADYLEITGRTVENNLYRAKKKLKGIMKKDSITKKSFYGVFNE